MHQQPGRALVLAFALSLAMGLHAQTASKEYITITGMVFAADGKPVPAAVVTCQSSAGIRARIVHTDAKGHYVVKGLKQDYYDVRAAANGAYSDWEKNIPLRKGQTKEVTLWLLNGNTAISGKLPAKQKK
jgi:hypothetical protein